MNIFCYCQQAEDGDGGPEREDPPQNASFKTSQIRQMFLVCKVSRWASVSQTQYISNLQKRKVKSVRHAKRECVISAPGYNRDYWTWLFVVLGPSTGLELSEASLLGGILSFSMSRSAETHSSDSDSDRNKTLYTPLASSKEVILWWGENPCSAPISEVFPPDSAPSGRAPVGVSPFSCNTCSDSSLRAQC